MITIAWYLLKVIICSGILCGYYYLALRNKIFHRWNRFYLLSAIIVSLAAPLIKINIFQGSHEKGKVIQVLQTISYGDDVVVEYNKNAGIRLTTENATTAGYLLISLTFLAILCVSLYKIRRLRANNPVTTMEGIDFINTDEKGTPFSFFRSVFWNRSIDLHSTSGQQIFNHEIAHVKEKHSWDKLFLQVVLVFFWANPFFWLIRKELYMIHEFIADKEAMEDSDISAFAEMILQTIYPGQNFSIGSSFFYSPIKRRIMMLAKNKNPKVSYLSRLLVLPLAALVTFAFTLKVNSRVTGSYTGKMINVVIDAGHGGDDNGAVFNGLKEKDITLQLAKKVRGLNVNDRIKIILSRSNDVAMSVHDRVDFTKEKKADIFIALHVNSSDDVQLSGITVLIDKNNSAQNQVLASSLIEQLRPTYKTDDHVAVRDKGVWVLDHSSCPAALVQCGYISNAEDAEFISNASNQDKIARDLLKAINNYAASLQSRAEDKAVVPDNQLSSVKSEDSIPSMFYNGKKVKSLQVQSASKSVKATASVIKVTYEDGSTEMITKNEADERGFVLPPPPPPGLPPSYFKTKALFVVDGREMPADGAEKIDPHTIKSINVLKGKEAVEKYGEKGKNGVVEITAEGAPGEVINVYADTIRVKDVNSTNNAKATGIKAVYIDSKVPDGTLIFIDGKETSREQLETTDPRSISSISVLKDASAFTKYGLRAKHGVIEIKTKPEITLVNTVNSITITGTNTADSVPDKVFTRVERDAQFPGGQEAWQRYITKKVSDSISKFTAADYGTCVVRFIVSTDGSVSDVRATTMQGTKLAQVAVSAVKNGPDWIPAQQNGRNVNSFRLQPVTLTNPDKKPKKVQFAPPKIVRDKGNVFVNPDDGAHFPGGTSAWLAYITKILSQNANALINSQNSNGTCKVKFVVGANGKVTEVEATSMKGTELAKVAVAAVKNGPDWIAGTQNGRAVASFVEQPVSFRINDELIRGNPKVLDR